MRLPARFRLKAFPDDKRLWKIDWFGDLLPNPNARSEPLLEVFIVPFKETELNQQTLKQKSSYDYKQVRKIEVGISLLPFLHLGTFWSSGIHQTTALTERVFLRNLQINPQNTRIIAAPEFKNYETLLSYFPSIDSCPETTFFEIGFPKDAKKKILIPSYEVIRFYFAGSSNLTRGIMTGGTRQQQNRLFDPDQTELDENTGVGNLILRNKLIGTDRHNVARLAFSAFAEETAWRIYSSIVRNLNNKNRRIVEAGFPFVGETNLQVCGKWFKQEEVWHLLVYFMETCSYPLPYKQLIWGIEGETEVNPESPKSEKENTITRMKPEDQGEKEIEHDNEPSLKEIFDEVFYDGRKFTDLDSKEKEGRLKAEKTESGTRYRVTTEKTDTKKGLSTGEGTFGSSETQGLKVGIGEDSDADNDLPKSIPAGWGLFTNILTELEKDSSIKTRILSFDLDIKDALTKREHGIYFPLNILGRWINWSFLDKQQKQRRQAMLAEINKDGKYFYLFDIEVNQENINDRYSMLVIKDENNGVLDRVFWKQILSDCAKNRGIKRDLWSWKNSQWVKVRHDLTEVVKYVFKISEFLV